MTHEPFEDRAEHDMINRCSSDLALLSHGLKQLRGIIIEKGEASEFRIIEKLQLNVEGLINNINKYASRARKQIRTEDKED